MLVSDYFGATLPTPPSFEVCCLAYRRNALPDDADPMERLTRHVVFADLFRMAAEQDPPFRRISIAFADAHRAQAEHLIRELVGKAKGMTPVKP